MSTLDSLDRNLVLQLGQDAHQTSGRLAKKLRCSPATIRRRLRRLISSGSLRIVGVADPADLGTPLGARDAVSFCSGKRREPWESAVIGDPNCRRSRSQSGGKLAGERLLWMPQRLPNVLR